MNQKAQRDALREFTYGLYVLTTAHEAEVNAMTCNWVTQISFKPLLILVAVERESYSHRLLQASRVFALNLLDKDQSPLARRMAVPHRLNPHKLASVRHHPGVTGVPLLDEAYTYLECEVRQILEIDGDHSLFIGKVVAGDINRPAEPLSLLAAGLRYK